MASMAVRYHVSSKGVATLTLNKPDSRNALDDELIDALSDALVRADSDVEARCIVIASSHPTVFSAGGDLHAFRDTRQPIEKYDGIDRFPILYERIAGMGKPVVAAVNGQALAGAFGLVLACDLVLAAESARFGCPEINVGAFPFMISALIHRNVGRLKSNELMLMGDRISAPDAARFGIVNRVVPDDELTTVVDDWSQRLAEKSPLLMRMGKRAMFRARDMGQEDALEFMRAQLALAFTTQDLAEGVNAFFERRAPTWSGK